MFYIFDLYPNIDASVSSYLNLSPKIFARQLEGNYFFIETAAAILENIKLSSQQLFENYILSFCRKHPYLQQELESIYKILNNCSQTILDGFSGDSEYFMCLRSLSEKITAKYNITFNADFIQNSSFLALFSVSFNIVTIEIDRVSVRNLQFGQYALSILIYNSNVYCIYQQPFRIANFNIFQYPMQLCGDNYSWTLRNDKTCEKCNKDVYNEEAIFCYRKKVKTNPRLLNEKLRLRINGEWDGEYNYTEDNITYKEHHRGFGQNEGHKRKCHKCENKFYKQELSIVDSSFARTRYICDRCKKIKENEEQKQKLKEKEKKEADKKKKIEDNKNKDKADEKRKIEDNKKIENEEIKREKKGQCHECNVESPMTDLEVSDKSSKSKLLICKKCFNKKNIKCISCKKNFNKEEKGTHSDSKMCKNCSELLPQCKKCNSPFSREIENQVICKGCESTIDEQKEESEEKFNCFYCKKKYPKSKITLSEKKDGEDQFMCNSCHEDKRKPSVVEQREEQNKMLECYFCKNNYPKSNFKTFEGDKATYMCTSCYEKKVMITNQTPNKKE